jgi:quaternary ammonium compound-resistance protein SugE
MAWVLLIIAGLLEIAWAIGLKYTKGFKEPVPSVLTILGMIASFYLLAKAVEQLPVGTAYAVWTGIGAAGTAILGIALFGESLTAMRVASIMLIVLGIVGVKLSS